MIRVTIGEVIQKLNFHGGGQQMNLGHEIKKRLSIFKNFYDVIRVMDPINKTSYIITENEVQGANNTCYCMWNKSNACENCVSMRALAEQDTFVKIEHDNEKVMMVTAISLEIEGITYIVEILKDITKNSKVNNIFDKDRGELITSVNERAVRTVAKEGNVQQHINIEERTSIENKNLRLLRIKNQIDELRETLNDVCCAIDEGKSNPDRLFISQCLDELIVKYMKELNS
jgi:hypothetical protein